MTIKPFTIVQNIVDRHLTLTLKIGVKILLCTVGFRGEMTTERKQSRLLKVMDCILLSSPSFAETAEQSVPAAAAAAALVNQPVITRR